MRLPRFVGDRITRQAIMSELRMECDSATATDDLPTVSSRPEQMDQAIDEALDCDKFRAP